MTRPTFPSAGDSDDAAGDSVDERGWGVLRTPKPLRPYGLLGNQLNMAWSLTDTLLFAISSSSLSEEDFGVLGVLGPQRRATRESAVIDAAHGPHPRRRHFVIGSTHSSLYRCQLKINMARFMNSSTCTNMNETR